MTTTNSNCTCTYSRSWRKIVCQSCRSAAAKKAAATRAKRAAACLAYCNNGQKHTYEVGKGWIYVTCTTCNGTGLRAEPFTNPYEVGDILQGSWGYDQTNQEFYQVVAVSAKGVTIRAVSRASHALAWATERQYPAKDQFIGAPLKRQVNPYGKVKLHDSCYLSKWDGAGKVETSYA